MGGGGVIRRRSWPKGRMRVGDEGQMSPSARGSEAVPGPPLRQTQAGWAERPRGWRQGTWRVLSWMVSVLWGGWEVEPRRGLLCPNLGAQGWTLSSQGGANSQEPLL